jgi:hypothetical protein
VCNDSASEVWRKLNGIWKSVNLVDGDKLKMVVETWLKRMGMQGGMNTGYECPTIVLIVWKVIIDGLIVGGLTVIVIYVAKPSYISTKHYGLWGLFITIHT